jgi:phosphomannomutase
MHHSIFREYDIRGKIDTELIIDDVYNLTRAIMMYFVRLNPKLKTVLVGRDGRISSPAIQDKMISALQDCGFDVIIAGLCPSPVLYYGLYTLPVDAGLMITASHNPKDYNGIKLSLGTKTIWGTQIKEIYRLYTDKQFVPKSTSKGVIKNYDLISDYVSAMHNYFPVLVGMKLPIVIDSGNGAGGSVLPQLVERMDWKNVQLLCVEVDGTYPNHEPDPTVEKNMADVKAALTKTDAVVGIGLDGDCDRMDAMTKQGFLVPGDQLLALFAQDFLKDNPHAAIVFDVKCSQGLVELLQQWHAKPYISPCGHAIIKEKMNEYAALLGGELSCHFFFEDRYFGYDDGIYAMMRLLEIIVKSGKPLDELLRIFPQKISSPEIRIASTDEQKFNIVAHLKNAFGNLKDVELITIDGVRAHFPYGWTSIRVSNTQPMLSVRFESDSLHGFEKIKKDIFEALTPYFEKTVLEKALNQR